MNKRQFSESLGYGLSMVQRRLYLRHIQKLYERYSADNHGVVVDQNRAIIDYLYHQISLVIKAIGQYEEQFAAFNNRYKNAPDIAHEKQYILEYAAQLGASRAELKADARAFSRWFGYEAMRGRYHRIIADNEQYLIFLLNRYSALLDKNIGHFSKVKLSPETLSLLLQYDNEKLQVAALECISSIIQKIETVAVIDQNIAKFIYDLAMNSNAAIWVQVAAMDVIAVFEPASLDKILEKRLSVQGAGDDLFFRYYAVGHLLKRMAEGHGARGLLDKISRDPSDYVRQKLAQEIIRLDVASGQKILENLLLEDSAKAVRAAALLSVIGLAGKAGWFDGLVGILQKSLESEKDIYVLRTALHVAVAVMPVLSSDQAKNWSESIEPFISKLHIGSESLAIRRFAAMARENLWVYGQKWRVDYLCDMQKNLTEIKPGHVINCDAGFKGDEAFRVLKQFAGNDFGLDIKKLPNNKLRVKRWQSFGLRLWRIWYEIANPSTDKRQGFQHSIGRKYDGNIQIPSESMAELSETKVPGEPLFIESEAGYRPYLPLPDMLISALDYDDELLPVKLFTSEGITKIYPPVGLKDKAKAYFKLSRDFGYYAELRNWREGSAGAASGYLSELNKLGFRFEFSSYSDDNGRLYKEDKAVSRFFPSFLPPAVALLFVQFEDYFFTLYKNTLAELMVFLFLVTAYFFSRQLWVGRKIRKMRKNIPLVIGGWGTRGKSGTERIKAALLNAMGFSVFSKTTGCEAMFLHSYAYGKLRELFLFRPYDKATIWEQIDVLKIADGLKVDVMLWECMALNPDYVKIMQKRWMRDDIATITNTYPDHEDIQGPAGINIPEVMTNFIPENAILVTSEEQMLPILKNAAKNLNTVCDNIGWLQAGMITDDIRRRFPYDEHPYNIALVLRLAREMGVDEAFALKAMADNVVLDLGVLKSYPVAKIMGRRLQFINGMSANERLAALNNWKQSGFFEQNHKDTPHIWTAAVINNRADRVSRSQVFADIMVNDLSVDRFYIIGTNINGLENYIEKAWADSFRNFSVQSFAEKANKFCVTTNIDIAIGRIDAMLLGLDIEIDKAGLLKIWERPDLLLGSKLPDIYKKDMLNAINKMKAEYDEYKQVQARILTGSAGEAECKALLWKWFKARLYVIRNKYATGNQIIETIAKDTPPGLLCRVMGMQNIKGTGLDFVYAWQDWEACYSRLSDMLSDDLLLAQKSAEEMTMFHGYNLLCTEMVNEVLAKVSSRSNNESIVEIKRNMELKLNENTAERSGKDKFIAYIYNFAEALLDSLDAITRRKKADNIYKDLVNERISHDRAIKELEQLNKRQQGGWL